MKKLLAFLLFVPCVAFATDYGSLPIDQLFGFTIPQGSPPFEDIAEFTTTANGPSTVTVKGSLHISSGSGRGAGYHTEYNVVDIDSLTVTDTSGNPVCQATETTTTTAYGGRQFTSWSCVSINIPTGTYLITFTGHIVSTGNMVYTLGYGTILIQ